MQLISDQLSLGLCPQLVTQAFEIIDCKRENWLYNINCWTESKRCV